MDSEHGLNTRALLLVVVDVRIYRLTFSLLAAYCVAHVAWDIDAKFCSVHYDPFGSVGGSLP